MRIFSFQVVHVFEAEIRMALKQMEKLRTKNGVIQTHINKLQQQIKMHIEAEEVRENGFSDMTR